MTLRPLHLSLAARGQTSHGIRAALHPRWAAALCVAPRTNSAAAIGPSSRLASGALRRSRCSREIIHGLLALLVFIGCGGTDPEHSVDLSGRWSDPNDPGLGTVTLHHDLSTDSLSGTWTHGDSLTLVGSLAGRSVHLRWHLGNFPFTYRGTVESDGETIAGTLHDWEGGIRPLTLARESRM